jgi:uncharacterized protein (TIGR02598 family)
LGIDPERSIGNGFTLVEVVVAIGIFSFCIVALIGLLQVALTSVRESQVDSSLASVIGNLSANLKTIDATELSSVDGTSQYFDLAGMPLAATNGVSTYFRAKWSEVDTAKMDSLFDLPGGVNLRTWVVAIEYPAPQYSKSLRFLVGRRAW